MDEAKGTLQAQLVPWDLGGKLKPSLCSGCPSREALKGFSEHIVACLRANPQLAMTAKGVQTPSSRFTPGTQESGSGAAAYVASLSDRKTWVSMTSVLALLLVMSTVGNIGLLLRTKRHPERSDYLYHPLQEVNGEASHTSTSAASETEDPQEQSQALLQSPG